MSHRLANVINAIRTITFVNNFGSVSVFVFVVKEAFDLPCLPQDYKDEIEIRELIYCLLHVGVHQNARKSKPKSTSISIVLLITIFICCDPFSRYCRSLRKLSINVQPKPVSSLFFQVYYHEVMNFLNKRS